MFKDYFQSLRSLILKEPQTLDKGNCYRGWNEKNDGEHVMGRGGSVYVTSLLHISPPRIMQQVEDPQEKAQINMQVIGDSHSLQEQLY